MNWPKTEELPAYEQLGDVPELRVARAMVVQALLKRSALAAADPYQFQWWALGLVGARPVEGKKGVGLPRKQGQQ